jgi:tetratricopeptide (TPR) repeat protein
MAQSILTRGQRVLLRILVWGGAALIADALFLLLFHATESTPRFALPPDTLPRFYQCMVLAHTALGVGLAPLALYFAIWHLKRAWVRRHNVAIVSGATLLASMVGLTYTGFFLIYFSHARENDGKHWTHLALAGVMPLVYVVHRVTSAWAPSGRAVVKAFAGIVATALVSTGIHMLTIPGPGHRAIGIDRGTVIATVPKDETLHALRTTDGAAPRDPFIPFVGYADPPRSSRFFPSAATTATGEWMASAVVTRGELPDPEQLHSEVAKRGFVMDVQIGATTCKRCHADIVEQWSHSAHRFSSMNNPFYRRAFLAMREKKDVPNTLDFKNRSQWCSGCHEPALMLAGEIGKVFDPDGPNAQAGLTCLSCHAIDALHNRTGNGAYNIPDDKETPYLFDNTSEGLLRAIGDVILKAKPAVHKERMLKPEFFRSSEYCSACHKVSLDVAVNQYRWFRGQNEYDNWHDSGVAQNAARTWYRPTDPVTKQPVKKICRDCHMPLEDATLGDVSAKSGKVRSHRFFAVNTALPALRGDTDTLQRIEKFLQDEKLRVDVFALRRLNDDGSEKEVVTALDRTQPTLVPGEKVEVQVVVRNKGVGHTFPGGTNDSNEGWLEFKVEQPDKSPTGAKDPLMHSGWVDPKTRQLDPAAHRYGAIIVAHDGSEAKTRNPDDFHVQLYGTVIPPSQSDVVRYVFTVPSEAAGSRLDLTASVQWRKFKQNYVDYVFAGKTVPEMPITLIASNKVTLQVGKVGDVAKPTPPPVYASPDQWVRPNDWGIGLISMDRKDTRLAQKAFEEVQRVAPARVDGWRNLARNYLVDGNVPPALELLAKCEEIAPGDPQTAWVWGVALQAAGRLAEAEEAYKNVLVEFPDDRDTLRRLGRTYYVDDKFELSLETYLKVLAIDPEDREAHYHRMLNYRALGKTAEAAEAQKAYEKYQIDESAQALTNEFRHQDENANLETNPIHTHSLRSR